MKPRAFVVCVDYVDVLSITLPRNRHHFEEVWVIASHADHERLMPLIRSTESNLFVTDVFYARGADFNKWAALEQCLSEVGRGDLIALLDADVVWPRVAPLDLAVPGVLLTPYRRMAPLALPIPVESEWGQFERHRNVKEWAGYSQVFWGHDPVLPPPPWHEVDWRHAGGADSIFQRLWPAERKARPGWEVLHLGEPGVNWFGRATRRLDGTLPEGAEDRRGRANAIWGDRRAARASGASEAQAFLPERLRDGDDVGLG